MASFSESASSGEAFLSGNSVSVVGQSLRSNGQDRTAGERDDTRRNAAQDDATEPGAAVSSEHDEIGPCGSGRSQDAMVGDSFEEEPCGPDPLLPGLGDETIQSSLSIDPNLREQPVVDLPRDETLPRHGDDNRIDVSDSERGATSAREIEGPAKRGA
jgi:hypothetical protein